MPENENKTISNKFTAPCLSLRNRPQIQLSACWKPHIEHTFYCDVFQMSLSYNVPVSCVLGNYSGCLYLRTDETNTSSLTNSKVYIKKMLQTTLQISQSNKNPLT